MEINGGSLRYTADMDISRLKAALKDGQGGIKGFSDIVSKSGDAMEKAFENGQKVIESQKKKIEELEAKYRDLQTAISSTPESGNTALTSELKQLQTEINDYKKGMADMENVVASFTDKNTVLTKELDSLKNKLVDVGQAQVQSQSIRDSFDLTTENIKIQKNVIADLETQYKDLQGVLDKMAPGQAKANLLGDANNLAVEIEAEKNALKDLQSYLNENNSKHETLRQKLLQVKNEMIELAVAGQEDSDRYRELTILADQYQEAINNVDTTMRSLRGNNTLNAIVDSLALVSSGMAVYQGVTALVAGENEKLDRIMVNLQATMSIAIGIQQLQNTLQRDGAVIQKVLAIQAYARARAEALATTNTIAGTVAQRAFNLVARANPYVLLATALLTVVGALVIFSNQNKKAAEEQEKLNKATIEGAADQIVAFKKLQIEYNRLGDNIQAKNKFIEENKDKFKDLGVEIENVADAENLLVKNSAAFVDALMLRAKAAAEYELAIENYKNYLNTKDEVDQKEQKYNTSFGGSINRAVDNFGSKYLGIGGPTKAENDEFYNTYDKRLRGSIKSTDEAAAKIEKAKIKIKADPPMKGSEEFYRSEITRLNELKSKAQVGSKEWNKYRMEIERIEDLINPKKPKKEKKGKELAEVFNTGSLAKLQQQLSLIDNSIQRVGNDGKVALRAVDQFGKEYTSKQIISLEQAKKKRLEIASEIAEKEKQIRFETLQQEIDRNGNEWQQYYSALTVLDKDQADNIFSDLTEKSQTHLGYVEKMQQSIIEKSKTGILTDQDKEDLNFLNERIKELTLAQNPLDSFKENIESTLQSLPSLVDQLKYLDGLQQDSSLTLNTPDNLQKRSFLIQQEKTILNEQQQTYAQFLQNQQTFEEQRIEIEQRYNNIRKKIAEDNILSDPEKKSYTAAANKSEKAEKSELSLNIFKQSGDWQTAFGDMATVSNAALNRIEASLLKFKETMGATLAPTELRELEEAIIRVQTAQRNNPFTEIIGGIKSLKQANIDVKTATDAYNATLDENGNATEATAEASLAMAEADRKASEAKRKLLIDTQKAQEIFNAVGSGLLELGDAFGGFDEATQDAINSIMDIGNAAFDLGKSIVSGDIAGIIKSGIKMIAGIAKALNGDKKKEREIKKQTTQLKGLVTVYDELSAAAERAFGSMKYKGQTDLIKNLEQQKNVLQGMINTENSKKKKDQEKIDGYQSQIQTINQSIASIKDNIIKDVLQTDVVDAAAKVGDALVDAFGRGEDAVESLEKTANDMIRNLLRNQLNLALQNKMKPILDKLLASSGFNVNGNGTFTGLTAAQIKEFKDQVVAAGISMQGFLDGYSEIFSGVESNAQGMKGDIKALTEKTAGALEAQINAMRINQVSSLAVARQMLLNLVLIEANTRRLHNIDKNISEMNDKMKKSLAGVP